MKNNKKPVKSPLRYPGGKSKAVKTILPLIPVFDEYREPMVGGGSVFFAVKQRYPEKKYWINDKNEELYRFWKVCRDNPRCMVAEIRKWKKEYGEKEEDGKRLYKYLVHDAENLTIEQKAARYFVLNRITFSGLAETGGYSAGSYLYRFTESSINRIYMASKILQGVKITNLDYSEVIQGDGEGVFIFLDPPYISKTRYKLYGKDGQLHKNFNHTEFAKNVEKCKHRWLITYDDDEEVNKLFKFANGSKGKIYKWVHQYGTNSTYKDTAKKGNELFILNYNINEVQKRLNI